MKVRFPGVLLSALLVTSAIGLSQAACQPKPSDNGARASAQIAPPAARPPQSSANTPKPAARPAAPRRTRAARPAGEEYAQSYYDYRSASRVIERFSFEPRFRRPVRFYRDRFYGPRDPRRYGAPGSEYPPPPLPPAYPPPRPGTRLDRGNFNGGVGDTGAGSGYGGQAYLYNRGAGSAVPSNGGGVNLPPGYGPDYHGVPQGPLPPSRGGLNAGSR